MKTSGREKRGKDYAGEVEIGNLVNGSSEYGRG